jgi:uncharacterized protein YkwD
MKKILINHNWLGLLLAASIAALAGCGGGGGTGLPINGVNDSHSGLDPNIVTPPQEYFVDLSESGDDMVTFWLKSVYSTLPAPGSSGGIYQNESLAQIATQIFNGINAERMKNGLPPYQRLLQMDMHAQAHARDMGLRNYFSHVSPDGMGVEQRWPAIDPPLTVDLGENAAKGQENAAEVVQGWLDSNKHRPNVLHPTFEYAGIGVYINPSGGALSTNFILVVTKFLEDHTSYDWIEPEDVFAIEGDS